MLVFLVFAFPADADRTEAFRALNKPGLSAEDNTSFGTPPDPTGAVGRRHYLEAVNSRLALFRRNDLRRVRSRDALAFWGKQPLDGQVVDPQVVWDDSARRWYYVALLNGERNEVLVAWSRNGDPADLDQGWCRMAIPTGALFDDFPNLGYSRNHILIGTNVADLATRQLLFGRLWAIGKPAPGDTSCPPLPVSSFGSRASPLRQVDGGRAFTLAPINPVRPSRRGYVIAADCIDEAGGEAQCAGRRRGNEITVWHVDGSRSAPRLTRDGGIKVRAYGLPSAIPQPRSKDKLVAGDTTLTQATSAPDPTRRVREAIWTQHTVRGRRGRSEVRWYELDPSRLSILRRGRIASRRHWAFNGAISPTWRGSGAAIHYNVAGRHLLPRIHARSRGPRTAKSVMRKPVILGRSRAPDRCGSAPDPCPWGDYAAATPDPLRRTVVWGSNELLRSTRHTGPLGTHWGTRNFAIRTDR